MVLCEKNIWLAQNEEAAEFGDVRFWYGKEMKQMKRKLAAIAAACVLAVSSCMPAFAQENNSQPQETLQSRYIKDIAEAVAEQYRFDITKEQMYEAVMDYVMEEHPELLEGAIRAATGCLDPFSGYFDREELEGFGNYIEANYVGIGVEFERIPGYIQFTSITSGGPAERAGLAAGDRLLAVNGEDATGFSINDAAQRVRGEEGTMVELTVLRGEEKLTFQVKREKVANNTISYEMIDDIGYLEIAKFSSGTPSEVKEALTYFDAAGTKKIIVDLRDNPGGELQSVLKVLYKFVPQNLPLTTIDYKDDKRDVTFRSGADFKTTDRKLVVLVNENTASAAELFAGAIRDNKLGTLIGRRTYGKGSVQEFMGLRSLGGEKLGDIKLTVAEYTLPNGECIHKIGIKPDVEIKNKYVPMVTEEFKPMDFAAKYTVGDIGDGVLAAEQRLEAFGYQVGKVDGTYDEETALAVKSFQENAGLYPYGVLDITTQTYLNNAANEAEVLQDLQLDAALDYFKNGAVNK